MRHPRRAGTPRRHQPARSRQRPAPQPARQGRHRDADAIVSIAPETSRKASSPDADRQTYRLEYTDDLTTHQWHPLTAPIPGDGKPVIVEDRAAKNRAQRFYRLIVLPQ